MATNLDTYQRLALCEQAALPLRKYASRKLLAWEQGVDELASERLAIVGAMRHDGDGRRDAAPGAVNATSASMGASERIRVPDSFDARPGSARATERPYSEGTFKRDVRTGRSPASKCEPFVTYSVPTWATDLDDDERSKLASAARLFALPSDERDEREPLVRQRANDERADRAARLRAAATTNDERLRA